MPGLTTYDPARVITNVGGAVIGGFADGEFIGVEHEADAFTKSTGADGQTTRVKQNDYSGLIRLILAQTSPSNDILTGFAILDRTRNAGIVPVIITDLLGTSKFATAYAWVRKIPAAPNAKEVSNREWMLDCAELSMFVGGNVLFIG